MLSIKLRVALSFVSVVAFLNVLKAQQVADSLFTFRSAKPEYEAGKGTVVVLDEAHHNFHTLNGRYAPFARVLKEDGYVVVGGNGKFSAQRLAGVKLLVIANAGDDGPWRLPAKSAFTKKEIKALEQWVAGGGSLFLIADHMPFAGAASALASAFGFGFINGYATKQNNAQEVFTLSDKSLNENELTLGRGAAERVDSITVFTGQAFASPVTAKKITRMGPDYKILLPEVAGQFNDSTPSLSGEGLTNGAYLDYGLGRVIIMGEAAMFSAQLAGPNQIKVGMNHPRAKKNAQFLLNCIHWLDRRY